MVCSDQVRVDHGREFYLVLAVQSHMKSMRNNTSRQPYIQTQSKQVIRLMNLGYNNLNGYNGICRKKINPQIRKKNQNTCNSRFLHQVLWNLMSLGPGQTRRTERIKFMKLSQLKQMVPLTFDPTVEFYPFGILLSMLFL